MWKNNYSPNDRFLIKFFINIISFDSSQRVPPMSPCPPLIITRVCPLLINPHVQRAFIKGETGKTWQGPPDLVEGGGRLLIRCWHYLKPPSCFGDPALPKPRWFFWFCLLAAHHTLAMCAKIELEVQCRLEAVRRIRCRMIWAWVKIGPPQMVNTC
jgi:hypothetical protein